MYQFYYLGSNAYTADLMKKYHPKRLGVLIPPLPWHRVRIRQAEGDDVVVLLHGLWRSKHSMEPLAKAIHEAGATTVNIPYASFRYSLTDLAEKVNEELEKYVEKGRRVHFITHSLGGIVLRELLSREVNFHVGKLVMLAPPNQGSEIVDWLSDSPLRWLLGPAGTFLGTTEMVTVNKQLPHSSDVLVVMGNKSKIPFFRKVLDADNDGIVSVEKGKLNTEHDFCVAETDRTMITSDAKMMEMVTNFICSKG